MLSKKAVGSWDGLVAIHIKDQTFLLDNSSQIFPTARARVGSLMATGMLANTRMEWCTGEEHTLASMAQPTSAALEKTDHMALAFRPLFLEPATKVNSTKVASMALEPTSGTKYIHTKASGFMINWMALVYLTANYQLNSQPITVQLMCRTQRRQNCWKTRRSKLWKI